MTLQVRVTEQEVVLLESAPTTRSIVEFKRLYTA